MLVIVPRQYVAGIYRRVIVGVCQQGPSEKRMVVALLIIDLAHKLFFVVEVSPAINDLTARMIRLWKAGSNVLRDRTEQCRIDAVVHKRSSQVDLPSRVAGRRGEGCKVAGKHCGGWNVRSRIAWV